LIKIKTDALRLIEHGGFVGNIFLRRLLTGRGIGAIAP
jgi:hypothetical protein